MPPALRNFVRKFAVKVWYCEYSFSNVFLQVILGLTSLYSPPTSLPWLRVSQKRWKSLQLQAEHMRTEKAQRSASVEKNGGDGRQRRVCPWSQWDEWQCDALCTWFWRQILFLSQSVTVEMMVSVLILTVEDTNAIYQDWLVKLDTEDKKWWQWWYTTTTFLTLVSPVHLLPLKSRNSWD